jgi:predicted permease
VSLFDGLRHRWRTLLHRDEYDRELEAERSFHLSLEAMHQVAAGATPPSAASAARRKFGNLTTQHEARRELTPLHRLEQLQRDIRFTWRQLWRAPAFSAGVIGTFALGIGANAAMFDVLDRLLLRPTPYVAAPERTHRVFLYGGDSPDPVPSTDYRTWRELTQWTTSFDATAVSWASDRMAVGSGLDSRELTVMAVSASFWSLFDARPALGRYFAATEDVPPSGSTVAVLGYEYWQSHFGGRTDVIGQSLQVGERRMDIIGVAPAAFAGFNSARVPAVIVPVSTMAQYVVGPTEPYLTHHCCYWLEMYARRKPGISNADANADLTQAYARSAADAERESPAASTGTRVPWRAEAASVLPERGPLRSRDARVVLWLSGVALIILLIACANVANLMVARATQRTHEFAVRTAIGVRRRRLLEQLLTESAVLAALGAVAGLALSTIVGAILRQRMLGEAALRLHFDARVVVFAVAVTFAAALLSGAYPAWIVSRRDVVTGLKAGPRSGNRSGAPLRAFLLALQAGLSVMLLIGAGVFVRSMQRVRDIPLGFDPDRVVYVYPKERSVKLTPAERDALLDRLMADALTRPDVEQASRATSVPFWNAISPRVYRATGDSLTEFGSFVLQAASPAYFQTMGTPLLRGRGILVSDATTSEPVMVVSDSMAKTLWPDRDPIGECIRVGAATEPCRRVVGVAGAIRRNGLMRERGMQYYVPATQFTPGRGGVVLRVRGEARQRAEPLRAHLQQLAPGDGYVSVMPLRDVMDPLTQSWRAGAWLFSAFGVLALLLACGGLYSMVAFDVTRRTHELGVRMALGAAPSRITQHVMRGTLGVASVGVVGGVCAAGIASPWLKSLVFKVSPLDPVSFAAAIATMIAAAAVASFIPARRAARIEPAICLRSP